MKIGLIGESPNDTHAFINLFKRQYHDTIEYKILIEDKRGGNLDDVKEDSAVMKQLRFEYKFEKPDFVVLIRDSDALEHEEEIEVRRHKMYALGNAVTQNTTYLFCIFEMETLLLADTDCVNSYYNTQFTYPSNTEDPADPMHKKEPKELLIAHCGYKVNDCATLFTTINFQKLLQVRFFAEFVEQFEKRIKTIA